MEISTGMKLEINLGSEEHPHPWLVIEESGFTDELNIIPIIDRQNPEFLWYILDKIIQYPNDEDKLEEFFKVFRGKLREKIDREKQDLQKREVSI